MVDVRCPNCNQLLFRAEAGGEQEVRCRRCTLDWVVTYPMGQLQIDVRIHPKLRPSATK